MAKPAGMSEQHGAAIPTRAALAEQLLVALNETGLGRGVLVSNVQRRLRLGYGDADRLMTLREACFKAIGALNRSTGDALPAPTVTVEQLEILQRDLRRAQKEVEFYTPCVPRWMADHEERHGATRARDCAEKLAHWAKVANALTAALAALTPSETP